MHKVSAFAECVFWFDQSFYEKSQQQRMMEKVATNLVASKPLVPISMTID